jgi:hypothetical protein
MSGLSFVGRFSDVPHWPVLGDPRGVAASQAADLTGIIQSLRSTGTENTGQVTLIARPPLVLCRSNFRLGAPRGSMDEQSDQYDDGNRYAEHQKQN